MGQRVRVNDPPISKWFSPLESTQTSIGFNVYCHRNRYVNGITFVTDPGFTKIGEASISVPYTNRPLNERGAMCEFSFSGTVLVVRVINPETGEANEVENNTTL